MMVQTSFLEIYGFGNILHRGAMEPLLTKNLRRSLENCVSGHRISLPNGRLTDNTLGGFESQGY
jgi:hypothetical protein